MNNFEFIMEILHPIFIAVATVVAGLIGTYGAKLIKEGVDWVKTKIGTERFNNAVEVATGIYIYLEDKYNISGMGETKKKEMEAMLLEKFPQLTQVELDSINKQVWLSFNEEWLDKTTVTSGDGTKRLDG